MAIIIIIKPFSNDISTIHYRAESDTQKCNAAEGAGQAEWNTPVKSYRDYISDIGRLFYISIMCCGSNHSLD